MRAICIRCGHEKDSLPERCPSCGFAPRSDEDKARALILSLDYEIGGEYRGKSKEELRAIGAAIAQGQPYAFDEAEVRSVLAYARAVLNIPPRKLLLDGVRWLVPPLLLLALIYLLLFAKR
ncbi:hypothetical protein MJ904_21530 [Massilia sp. MB5]|uniref:hypothetical protein n=1 Tax=Massilia sp. MB5 TaxID=2919578 RepID=UPI001F10387F|nr:hypothetical protein [Massilia sp. MB5]UMR29607.1 hypothetical protein MJ904_21530 [Massilia sp. MB5]